MTMLRVLLVCLSVIATLIPPIGLSGAENGPPRSGEALPDFDLPVPQNSLHGEYLGIKTGKTFKISQIDADFVIIEIFSMYCPHCQREAPTVNNFYQKIQNDEKLRDRFKMIGIGAGNSDFEVDYFRDKYDIPFPLFSDADFTIHKTLGEVRTPYFLGIRMVDSENHRVFYSQLGGPHDSRRFLDKMLQETGVKQEAGQ